MGGGKGGGTSTTNNISKTEIPPEVLARYNAVNARAETVAQQPYQRYSNDPNAFVAGLTPTQTAGIQNTNLMAGAAQPYYGAATNLAAQSTGNVDPSALNVGQYMNPYTQSVVNATQAAMNQQQGQQLSQQQTDAIRGGAFGGDRANLQRGILQGQQSLAQAQAIAPLYQQNYNQALAAAQQQQGVGLGAAQANRQNLQNAATLFGSIGTNAQQAGLAGSQAQMAAGQAQQQTEQAGKQAMYNQFMQEQGYPFQVAQFLANIATGTGALSGNTTAGTSTTTTSGGGGFFSDERLKENIKQVGETNDGQPIYRYNYKGDPRTQIGLIAQEVEKSHPEAVGSSQGYKTVDYKKATQGAIHKTEGGGLSEQGGADAYRIDAPSAMLSNPLIGAQAAARMASPGLAGGMGEIPVRSMTPASEIAGVLAPKATGVSPGTYEGARAQKSTLDSILAGGDAERINMGAGKDYLQSESDRLGKFLAPYSAQYASAGGLVGPEGGAFAQGGHFARGGLAFGGMPDFGKGIYGVEITPMQQRQMMQGTPMQSAPAPQKPKDGIAEANQVAGLVGNLNTAYKARPNFLRSAEDVANRTREEAYKKAIQEEYLKKHGIDPEADKDGGGGTDLPTEGDDVLDYARGGLAGARNGFYEGGYLNPQGYVSGVLEEQGNAPPPRKLANSAEDFAKPQKQQGAGGGGLGDVIGAGMKLNSLRKGGEWAAGKLGLTGPETAMSATSTEALPGVASGSLPEAATAAVPETLAAETTAAPLFASGLDAGAMAGGLLPASESIGLIGGVDALAGGTAAAEAAAAAAAAAEAAAGGEALLAFLPFLSDKRAKHDIKKVGSLFDGQPVYRFAYNGDDKTQMGLIAQNVEHARPEAVGLAGGMKTVDYKKATDKAAKRGHYQGQGFVVPDEYSTAEPELVAADGGGNSPEERPVEPLAVVPVEPPVRGARAATPAPGLGAAPPPKVKVGDNELTIVPPGGIPDNKGNAMPPTRPAKPVERRTSASEPTFPSLGGLVPMGAREALSSEDFWVPALSGIGAMLASPNKTLAGAIGSGLVGGTSAYTGLQKQQGDIAKQRIEGLKSRFVGPTLINGQMMYRDTWNGDNITQQEYSARVSQHITGKTPGAASPAAVGTARDVITEGAPKIERPPAANTNQTTVVEPNRGGAPAGGAKPPGGATVPAQGEAPVANAAATGTVPAPDGNLIAMDQAMLDNEDLWKGLPLPMRPKTLLNDAAAMDEKIRRLEANRAAIEQAVGETDQSKAISSEIASLRTDREAKVARAQQQMSRATKLQEEAASAEIKRKSGVQEEADKIELLPRKQQLELEGEVAKLGRLNPISLQQKQAEADIQRAREVQTARDKLPIEEERVAFDANVKRQDAALQKAAAEAKEAQIARSQAQAALSVMFDKNGKAVISSGPLGTKIANVAAYMSQLGFSDKFIEDFTNTKPSNAQALAKLQTAMAAEIARLEFNGAPVRQSEFLQFLQTTPGATLLPEAFKWIVEKTIIPKTEASINAYKRVKDFTPGIGKGTNIEGELFDYYDQNPWFRKEEPRLGEEPTRRTLNRAQAPELTNEEKAQLAQEIRQRRASQGAR